MNFRLIEGFGFLTCFFEHLFLLSKNEDYRYRSTRFLQVCGNMHFSCTRLIFTKQIYVYKKTVTMESYLCKIVGIGLQLYHSIPVWAFSCETD